MRFPERLRRPLTVVVVLVVLAGATIQAGFMARAVIGAIPSHVYWTEPNEARMVRDVAALKAVLPLLEELQLTDFRDNDWCHELVYSRGGYWTDPDCVAYGDPITPFPPEAKQAFERVGKALAASGVWVVGILAEYGTDRRLSWAEFDLNAAPWRFDRWSYLYETGFPPEDGEDIYTQIDANWYFHWGDWL